ncbi:hypothetical protein B0T18DRAFT_390892 [Schizothecium vesticola]|uniref:Uncharacterized protein n=1 Tax=Schizothecium vesticola TaxID=314040 RepID=A0AA40K593_9PEZI|nr:hypothetical protein B0T18DRAFT_390892 [Schizothecium vesticola]
MGKIFAISQSWENPFSPDSYGEERTAFSARKIGTLVSRLKATCTWWQSMTVTRLSGPSRPTVPRPVGAPARGENGLVDAVSRTFIATLLVPNPVMFVPLRCAPLVPSSAPADLLDGPSIGYCDGAWEWAPPAGRARVRALIDGKEVVDFPRPALCR